MLELWGMRSTCSLPSLQGPLRPGVLAPDKSPMYRLNRTKPWFLEFTVFAFKQRKIELFWHLKCIFMLNWIILKNYFDVDSVYCPVDWGCRIKRLHLCWVVRPHPTNECPAYGTKQSDGEVPVMLELWGIRDTPSLPSLPGPLWPGVVAPDRARSMG